MHLQVATEVIAAALRWNRQIPEFVEDMVAEVDDAGINVLIYSTASVTPRRVRIIVTEAE